MVLDNSNGKLQKGEKFLMNESTTLTTLLTNIGSIVTQVLTWVGSVCETIVTTPLLYLSLGFFCIGGVCGLIGRMLSKNQGIGDIFPFFLQVVIMVFSDFSALFMLILNKLLVNPFFVIIYQTIMVLILVRIAYTIIRTL